MLLLPPLLRLPLTSLVLVVFARRYEVEFRMLMVLVLRTKGVSGEISATFFFFLLTTESTSSFCGYSLIINSVFDRLCLGRILPTLDSFFEVFWWELVLRKSTDMLLTRWTGSLTSMYSTLAFAGE